MTIMMYAPAIHDALRNKDTTLEELIALRDHAYAIINQQGDLEGAVKRLENRLGQRKA